MKIIRVINNNNVCVLSKHGKEQIVSGKGIGFAKKIGDEVLPSQIQKTYLITDSKTQERLIELLSDIPDGYVKFTDELVEHIKTVIPQKLNESLLITLSDHICFAIKRKRQGIEFTNPMMDSLRTCYPEELSLGYYCLEQIENRLKVSLISDEAGFIAMHIINARLETDMTKLYDITKIINSCGEIVLHNFKNADRNSTAFERFMIHTKYLVQRIFDNAPLEEIISKDLDFLGQLKEAFPDEFKCAKEISQYILETKNIQLSKDELITITMHIVKISQENLSR